MYFEKLKFCNKVFKFFEPHFILLEVKQWFKKIVDVFKYLLSLSSYRSRTDVHTFLSHFFQSKTLAIVSNASFRTCETFFALMGALAATLWLTLHFFYWTRCRLVNVKNSPDRWYASPSTQRIKDLNFLRKQHYYFFTFWEKCYDVLFNRSRDKNWGIQLSKHRGRPVVPGKSFRVWK